MPCDLARSIRSRTSPSRAARRLRDARVLGLPASAPEVTPSDALGHKGWTGCVPRVVIRLRVLAPYTPPAPPARALPLSGSRRPPLEMSKVWRGREYNLLRRNCCHFSDALCVRMGVGPIPTWVHRLADAGAALSDDHAAAVEVAMTRHTRNGRLNHESNCHMCDDHAVYRRDAPRHRGRDRARVRSRARRAPPRPPSAEDAPPEDPAPVVVSARRKEGRAVAPLAYFCCSSAIFSWLWFAEPNQRRACVPVVVAGWVLNGRIYDDGELCT